MRCSCGRFASEGWAGAKRERASALHAGLRKVPASTQVCLMMRSLPFLLACLALAHLAPAAVSVSDFGAKGDGAADDTRAIQAALDSGEHVTIPRGTFRITNALQPKANQVVELIGTVRVSDSNIQPLTA